MSSLLIGLKHGLNNQKVDDVSDVFGPESGEYNTGFAHGLKFHHSVERLIKYVMEHSNKSREDAIKWLDENASSTWRSLK